MLRRCHDVAAHVGRLDQVADTERIGETERLAQLPHFERRGRMHDLRARVGRRAAIENAPSCPSQRICLGPVGKREARAWIEAVNLLRSGGAARLSKSNIERHEAAADVRKRAIEHDLAALVAIEPEMDERAHEAAALRAAHHDRLGILDEYRVVAAVIILRLGL